MNASILHDKSMLIFDKNDIFDILKKYTNESNVHRFMNIITHYADIAAVSVPNIYLYFFKYSNTNHNTNYQRTHVNIGLYQELNHYFYDYVISTKSLQMQLLQEKSLRNAILIEGL